MIKLKHLLVEYTEYDEGTVSKMDEDDMKDVILNTFNTVSFRKFGNVYRKHIDKYFTRKSNHAHLGSGMSWEEQAGYIIMDGNYTITKKQFINFMKEFK